MRSPSSLLFWMIVLAIVAGALKGTRELGWPRLPLPGLSRAAVALPPAGAALSGRARVIDGDSLELAGAPIRLFGIDAPESRQA